MICPECGKEFTRAASLGAHRNRAHGVTGASSRRGSKTTTTSTPRRAGRPGIDRDALLQVIFPQGIPAKERVIREVNLWLDEADRLARQG